MNSKSTIKGTNKKNEDFKQKFLITSALPYVNNIPHLGNLICVISADVYTRFLRLKKENVISVLGTDEHGTTAEVKAKQEGITPKQLVNKYYKIHTEIYDWFNCKFDCFGRTSDEENYEISQEIFLKLKNNGFISKQDVEQYYCEHDKMFLADRFVEGTCKFCGFDNAKGDQCDKCGKLLEHYELLNPKCTLCNNTPVIKKSTHFFIRLDKLQPKLEKWIEKNKTKWTHNALSTTNSWLKEGLKPRAITRDLKWGIPVPIKGFEDKVLYSWFDAPIGYISITKKARKDWKEWWYDDKKVNLTQFMGKDNIPFHTILFPSYIIGTKENYTMMKSINVNEYLNYEKGKFSKSRGIGVFGDDAQKTGIDSDIFRFYMMINRPEKTDTVFSWKDFQEKLNSELVGNYGNLINRVITFTNRFFESKIPAQKSVELDYSLNIERIENAYKNIELKKVCKEILELSKLGNQFFQEKEPWSLIKLNAQETENILANLLRLIKDLAILSHPIMPEKSREILEVLNTKQKFWSDLNKPLESKTLMNSRLFFQKLEDDQVEKLKKKFSGGENSKHNFSKDSVKDDFSKVDLRVAKIIKVEDHPNAEKLLKLKISLGSEERQLVAGLKEYYEKQQLLDKKIVVVANLKPAKLRGEISEGMLLAVDDGKNVAIITSKAKEGTRVLKKQTKYLAKKNNNPEKEMTIEEFFKLNLKAKNGQIFYKDQILTAEKMPIINDKKIDGIVR